MKLVDISHVINGNTPIYPGDSETSLSKVKNLENDDYNAYLLQTGLHTGTHIDAPMHLLNDIRTIADFSADRFIGAGVLLNVCGESIIKMKPEYEQSVIQNSIVLLYTGFDKHYREDKYFTDHPVVGEDFAEFLLSKNIKMLGMDMPSPDYPPFAVHKALLAKGVFILENLTNLQNIVNAGDFEVIALPLKIPAEASLVRAVCSLL